MGADEEIAAVKRRVALIEARLDQLFTHLQVEPRKAPLPDSASEGEDGWWGGSEPGAPSEKVIELVRAGNKIQAIKVHHEQTGLGLAEAKRAIDEL